LIKMVGKFKFGRFVYKQAYTSRVQVKPT
jgi:hypothetical protein